MNKEKNFLSAVLYVRNDEAAVGGTLPGDGFYYVP